MTKPAIPQFLRFTRLVSLAALAPLSLTTSACAQTHSQAEQGNKIVDYVDDDHSDMVATSRYELEIYSGAGIPGSAGANQFIRDARSVVLGIVEQCQLGQTIWRYATDGVSLLTIVDQNLTETQVACLREAERPGLRLRDMGTNG